MRSTARAWPAGTAEASAAARRKEFGAAHLLLQQPGRGVFGLGLEGVGADELGEVGGLVRFGGAQWAHLGERDVAAGAAAWSAASGPASPPPMMWMCFTLSG